MVFGGYADDLRTRPSAITSLSKMPWIEFSSLATVFAPRHFRSRLATIRELARSLNARAFIRTVQRAPQNWKPGKELECRLHREFLEKHARRPHEYSLLVHIQLKNLLAGSGPKSSCDCK